MDYARAYNDLVETRRGRDMVGRVEKHHVKPRSLGGCDSPENIVPLTGREHFVAHRLLAKIHGGPMWVALAYMARGGTKSGKGARVTSRVYGKIKEEDAKYRSTRYTGEGNYWYGKKIPLETRLKQRGPRPQVSGENHHSFGKKRSRELVEMVEEIKRFKPRSFTVDTSLRSKIESLVGINEVVGIRGDRCRIKTPELRALYLYYKGVLLGEVTKKRGISGDKNPNYGNGDAIRGEKNPMFGKQQKASTKAKIGEKAKRTITCPHCGKVGNIANMHRWHLDNCKARNGN